VKKSCFLFVVLICFFSSSLVFSQEKAKPEVSFSSGAGYMSDDSGNGSFQYVVGGVNFVKDNYLIGPFFNFTNVGVEFGGYKLTAQEITLGPNFAIWGDLSDKFQYSAWLAPGMKYFSDHGKNNNLTEEAWQEDWGLYGISGVNISDKDNRWFRNYKLQLQYQKNIVSSRRGTWTQGENITDSINVKAVNKAYFKTQFEIVVKKINLGKKGRFEPKLVVSYLYDSGAKKSAFEYGSGVAISFSRGSRYFEAFSLQYRARYDLEFADRLDLVEIGVDFVNLYKLLIK